MENWWFGRVEANIIESASVAEKKKISIWIFLFARWICFCVAFTEHWKIRFNHKHDCELFHWCHKLYLWLFQWLYHVIANMKNCSEKKNRSERDAAMETHFTYSYRMWWEHVKGDHNSHEWKKKQTEIKNINKSRIMRLSWQ